MLTTYAATGRKDVELGEGALRPNRSRASERIATGSWQSKASAQAHGLQSQGFQGRLSPGFMRIVRRHP